MGKRNLKQHYRGEDGKLYRAGRGVEVPKEAGLKIAKISDSAGEGAATRLPQNPTGGTTADTDSGKTE